MGKINITDTKTVKNNANSAISSLVEIKKTKNEIDKIFSELSTYWAENSDQQQFAEMLSGELQTLQEVILCTQEFCSAISDYIDEIETTSRTTATIR